MIAWKITRKKTVPILICDWCLKVIKNPALANVISIGQTENCLIVGWMVHKDDCDRQFSDYRVIPGSGWWSLSSLVDAKCLERDLNPNTRIALKMSRAKLVKALDGETS